MIPYTLWLKHASHQKAESFRAAFRSNLDDMVNKSSNFNGNSLENGRCSFIFTTHLVDITNAAVFTKKQFFFFSQFSLPYFTLTCSQNCPYNPH